jgi:DDE superfamily endonuclease
MAPMTRAQRREYHAKHRRLQKYREQLQREQARAQRSLHALEQALVDLGLPETLATEVQWRLKAVGKLMGKIFGLMFPTLFGCRTYHELTRVRGWDKNLPSQILGALPKQKWLRQLQHRGQDLLVTLWHQVEGRSPATRSRWQWTWVSDDSVFKKSGQQLGLVGSWYSGQEHRVRLGIDGLLLIVVIGEGKLVIPVDFTVRRPDPMGPGRPCRDKLTWLQVMLDRTWTALQRLGLVLPAPLVVADSWFGDSKLLAHLAHHQHGTMVVEGKRTYVFQLPDGRRVTGQELVTRADWPWRDSLQLPGMQYARLTATSPTYGPVTVIIVKEPGETCYYLLCQVTPRTAPCLIRAWKRRSWIEHSFRTLKHLLAAEACQVHEEDAYYGHLVLRLLAGLVLFYTTRRLFKGHVTMEAIVFSLKHHWRFLNSKDLELHELSWDLRLAAA